MCHAFFSNTSMQVYPTSRFSMKCSSRSVKSFCRTNSLHCRAKIVKKPSFPPLNQTGIRANVVYGAAAKDPPVFQEVFGLPGGFIDGLPAIVFAELLPGEGQMELFQFLPEKPDHLVHPIRPNHLFRGVIGGMVEFDIQDRCTVQGIQVLHDQPAPFPFHQLHGGGADGIGPHGGTGCKYPHLRELLFPDGMHLFDLTLLRLQGMGPVEYHDVGESLDPFQALRVRFINNELGELTFSGFGLNQDLFIQFEIPLLMGEGWFHVSVIHGADGVDSELFHTCVRFHWVQVGRTFMPALLNIREVHVQGPGINPPEAVPVHSQNPANNRK